MRKPELLPCPFCGGEAEFNYSLRVEPVINENGAYVDADTYYYECVTCTSCGATIQLNEDEPDGITIEKWNQRIK